jgi:phytoene dehydrogenase-like protein
VSGAEERFDAVVIGAGVGGLVAAARLAMAGRRPLLIEAEARLGGRFSTIEQSGYKLPTGAVAVETKGPFWDIFTVNADELPAGVFFRNLRETGGYKRFGFAPHGNVAIADALAAAVVERGGRVERRLEAGRIEFSDGLATTVHARGPDGVERSFDTDAVISNVGPRNTARLVRSTPPETARIAVDTLLFNQPIGSQTGGGQ